ncbi:MAG: hypothetical protein WCS37_06720 [Chloroflexota bacterium]
MFNEEAHFENRLNLLVSSRFPQRFFDYMEAHQCKFEQDKTQPWFWRCQVGLQEVVVIACRNLPLEQPYYKWLLFVHQVTPIVLEPVLNYNKHSLTVLHSQIDGYLATIYRLEESCKNSRGVE